MNVKFRENLINDFFNSKAFAVLTAIALIVVIYVNCISGAARVASVTSRGVLFQSVIHAVSSPTLSVCINAAAIILTAITVLILNKMFNFIRSVTWIFVSVFFLLTMSTPIINTYLFTGTMLNLTSVVCIFLVFATFQRRMSQRSIFSAFAIVSAASMFHYAYIYLMPVLFLGYMLMQVMHLRAIFAMIIGIITPYWIVLGLGFASFSDFSLPAYQSVLPELGTAQLRLSIIYIAILVIVTIALTALNLMKIINYKLQVRAYNGYFIYLTVANILMMIVDYKNAFVYLPMLNMCLSVQFAHFFTLNNHTRRYVTVLIAIAACTVSAVLQIIL